MADPARAGGLLFVSAAALYRILIARAFRHLRQARDTRDLLFQHFRTLTEGMKELKLHADRRQAFLTERIDAATEALKRDAVAGIRHHLVADALEPGPVLRLLGSCSSRRPSARSSTEAQTGYLLAILYMMTPVWGVMELWPIMARARIALEKVRALGLSLGSPTGGGRGDAAGASPRPGTELEFDGVTFGYGGDADGPGFVLGPIDFALRRGELVFLVGGNGSGKSTFVKVLSGLYAPTAGHDPAERPGDRRQEPGVVPPALLGGLLRLLPLRRPARAGRARPRRPRAGRHLIALELDRKVRVEGGAFSTTALSQGQRKRLALLAALPGRPADLRLRRVGGRPGPPLPGDLLPGAPARAEGRGKTVIVISHDDRYYDLGDRVFTGWSTARSSADHSVRDAHIGDREGLGRGPAGQRYERRCSVHTLLSRGGLPSRRARP